MVGDFANWVDLLNTIGSELDVGGKVFASAVLVQGAVDERGLNNTLLALRSLQQALGETGTSHSHGERCRPGTSLGLNNLVTTELHAVDVRIVLLASQAVSRLGEEGNDGRARVATDDRDVLVGWVSALDLRDEAAGANDIEGADTKDPLCVVHTLRLEDLGADWNGGVDLLSVRAWLRVCDYDKLTGFEMMRMLASGECSAAALAKSRTMEALVLNKSVVCEHWSRIGSYRTHHHGSCQACEGHRLE
jgi:hypothetical protein